MLRFVLGFTLLKYDDYRKINSVERYRKIIKEMTFFRRIYRIFHHSHLNKILNLFNVTQRML